MTRHPTDPESCDIGADGLDSTIARDASHGDEERDPVEELVARCILAFEAGGDEAIASVLAAHPAERDVALSRLESLRKQGLLAAPVPRPDRIGPYRVVDHLGRGGMGTVYLAEQRAPVRRTLAIKVLRLGLDSHDVLARFAIERQTLAVLDHPAIAKIFDAGLTDEGRPFLAMEYVEGVPLTKYCDRRGLGVRERIRLLIEICDAVQHAHHKGVIHRDLKPSNILVSEVDGRARPKIIDFGVAKATHGIDSVPELHTTAGHLLGTPEYMSPEQAGGDGIDVDTRTDVYSLGVVLYELLTGTLPFESERLRRSSSVELRRILREEEPISPSKQTRGTVRESLPSESTVGPVSSMPVRARVERPVPGRELDWITLRALEKDRDRRYATPRELASDLERYLAGEAVEAGPRRASYRFVKFVARNRVLVAAGTLVALALTAGLATSLVYAGIAREKSRQESEARQLAELHFAGAREAVDAMLERVGDEDLALVPGMEAVRRELVARAHAFHERFFESRKDDEVARFDVARSLLSLARIERLLGDHDASERALERADGLLESLGGIGADREDVRASFTQLLGERGLLRARVGKTSLAIVDLERAVSVLDAAADPKDRDEVAAAELHLRLAEIYRARDKARALAEHQAADAIHVRLLAREVSATRLLAAMRALREHGNTLFQVGSLDEVGAVLAKAVDIAKDPVLSRDDPRLRDALASVAESLAWARSRQGDTANAERQLARATDMRTSLCSDFPKFPNYRAAEARLRTNHASILTESGKIARALDMCATSIEMWDALTDEFPTVPNYRHGLARSLTTSGRTRALGRLYGIRTDIGPAVDELQRALSIYGVLRADDDDVSVTQHEIEAATALGLVKRQAHDVPGSNAAFAHAREVAHRCVESDPGIPLSWFMRAEAAARLGFALIEEGDAAHAAEALDDAIESYRRGRELDASDGIIGLRECLYHRGGAAQALGDEECVEACAEALVVLVDPWLAKDYAARLFVEASESSRDEAGRVRRARRGVEIATEAILQQEADMNGANSRATLIVGARSLVVLGRLHRAAGDFEAAAAKLEEAIARSAEAEASGGLSSAARKDLRIAYQHRVAIAIERQPREALAIVERCVRSFPDDVTVRLDLAGMLARAEDPSEDFASRAVALLEDACRRFAVTRSQLEEPRFDPLRDRPDFENLRGLTRK
ncbi:MAG: protein kinase [Planctomycetes bacterium]|nr:protein kinase [Planctomycetota bacterium]